MAKFGIGDSVRRVEDPRLLTGGGRYTDDTKLSSPAARAYVLRSPHAHADIKSIDTAAAKKARILDPANRIADTELGHAFLRV
jgi:carbon-monoxide dehydrogenase large subunit